MPSIIWMSKCKLKCVLRITVRVLSRLDDQCCGPLIDKVTQICSKLDCDWARSDWCSWGPILYYFLRWVESNNKGSGKNTLSCKFGHLFVGSRSLRAFKDSQGDKPMIRSMLCYRLLYRRSSFQYCQPCYFSGLAPGIENYGTILQWFSFLF